MHFQFTVAVALSGSLAIAGPLESRATKKQFTVNQVAIEQQVLPPALQVLRTYQKYMKEPPTNVVVAAKAAVQSGSVSATPQSYDLAYLSPVTVGGQTFNLNFDTGSADLWVYSNLQPSSQTAGRTVYNPANSPNATAMTNEAWKITYGDGSGAAGLVYADSVVIGGVTATSQAVEAATSVSQQFLNDAQSNGLVGFAFSSLNTVRPNQQTTFFDTVGNSLATKLFTVNLMKGAPGSYDFGYIDSAKYSGPITWAPVQAYTGFWQLAMGGYTIAGQSPNTASMGNGIADTGTTLLYLPDAVASDYWANVIGAYFSNQFGAYIFPCASPLPNFAININGRDFVVPGNYLNYAPISNTMCFGGLQSNSGIGFSILGDVFLKAFFVVFDASQAGPRLGFADKQGQYVDPSLIANSTLSTTTTTTTALTSLIPSTTPASSSLPTTTTTTTTPLTYASSPSSTSVVVAPPTTLSSQTVAPVAASIIPSPSPIPSSSSSSSKPLIAQPTTVAPVKPSPTTTKKTTTTTTTTKKTTTTTTTTTTKKTTTPVARPTTTRRQIWKARHTTAKRKLIKLPKKLASLSPTQQKQLDKIMEQKHPQAVTFCQKFSRDFTQHPGKYKHKESPVTGVSKYDVSRVCKLWLAAL